MRRLHSSSPVAEAVRRVSVVAVLLRMGVEIDGPPEPGSSRRVVCPLTDLNHSDEFRDHRQMRVYSDNRAYCYGCSRQYDSVSLMATHWGCSYTRAAERLLASLEEGSTETLVRSRMPVVRANVSAALAVWAEVRGVVRSSDLYAVWMRRLDDVESEESALEWLSSAKRSLK